MQKVGIVCHDEGGSELLSNWVGISGKYTFLYSLSGPAKRIFKKNLDLENSISLKDLVEECDWLLCGTSWQSDTENIAIKAFKDKGKKTIAFLDHWNNYEERFRVGKELILPDEIWVADEYAERLANECFSDIPIKQKENVYLSKVKQELLLANKDSESDTTVLYVCEPIREHALLQEGDERYWGYTEEEALKFFLDNIPYIPKKIEHVLIRPHPSENQDKYNWALERSNFNIRIGGDRSLVEEIGSSSVVVGCESMAMILGLVAGKLVLTSIPPGGRDCVLPHKDIVSLKKLVSLKNLND